jgi:hypothetical protein
MLFLWSLRIAVTLLNQHFYSWIVFGRTNWKFCLQKWCSQIIIYWGPSISNSWKFASVKVLFSLVSPHRVNLGTSTFSCLIKLKRFAVSHWGFCIPCKSRKLLRTSHSLWSLVLTFEYRCSPVQTYLLGRTLKLRNSYFVFYEIRSIRFATPQCSINECSVLYWFEWFVTSFAI